MVIVEGDSLQVMFGTLSRAFQLLQPAQKMIR